MARVVHFTIKHRALDTRIFLREARSLAAAGYETWLLAPEPVPQERDGVRFQAIPAYRSLLREPFGLATVFRETLKRCLAIQADIYHFHDPELIPVGLQLHRRGHRVIYDAHEHYPRKLNARPGLPTPLRRGITRVYEAYEQYAAARFDAVVAVTEHIAASFPSAKRTCVVHNYADTDLIARLTNQSGAQRKSGQLIYTGGVTPFRGIWEIANAMQYVQHPDARLVIVGPVHDQELLTSIRQLPAASRIQYNGVVAPEEVYRLLGESEVGLVCNQPVHDYQNARPNKLFEYLAAGVPVIASDFPAWREIIGANRVGLHVDPTSPQAIARAVDELLSDRAAWEAMSERTRSVAERYSWRNEAKKLMDLYGSLGIQSDVTT